MDSRVACPSSLSFAQLSFLRTISRHAFPSSLYLSLHDPATRHCPCLLQSLVSHTSTSIHPSVDACNQSPHDSIGNQPSTITAQDGSAGDYAPVGSGALERGLYLLRRRLRGMADEKGFGADSVYVASFSSRTITYKGMVNSNSLGLFYKDVRV